MLNLDIGNDFGVGAGMPKGNKKAGFVGLMLAKKHLRKGVNDYTPPATEKNTPARFDVGRITQPSAYIQNVYGQQRQAPAPRPRGRPRKEVAERSARGRFLAGEREQLGEEKLAQLREAERLRAQKARDKKAVAKINAMAEGEAKEQAKRNFQLLQQSRGAGMTGGLSPSQDKTLRHLFGMPKKKGGAMPKQQTFWEGAKASYANPPPQTIADNFHIVFNTPTMDAYLNDGTRTILVAVRGTKPTDVKDLSADASLVINGLSRTDRYKTDKASMERLLQMFPPNQFEYYLTAHSLGGAVVNSLKRDFPMLKNAEEYNPAYQPYDFLSQQTGSIHRNYINTDALYRLGGRFFGNTKVLPPLTNTTAPSGVIGNVMTAYEGHALDNFKGRGKMVQMPEHLLNVLA